MKAMVWPLIDETSNMFLQYSALVVVWWLSSKTLKAEKVFKFRYTPPALHQTLHNLTHTNSKTFFLKKNKDKKRRYSISRRRIILGNLIIFESKTKQVLFVFLRVNCFCIYFASYSSFFETRRWPICEGWSFTYMTTWWTMVYMCGISRFGFSMCPVLDVAAQDINKIDPRLKWCA